MDYVYHGSPVGGLTNIEPNVSTHGKSYVYATKDKALALVFLQKHTDYLTNISFNDDWVLELTERKPDVFKDIFKGKSGYLYYLNPEHFQEGKTSFSAEVVSENIEKVIKAEKIEDSYDELLKLQDEGLLKLYFYPDRPDYIPKDDSDLIRKTKYFLDHSQDKYKKGLIDYAIETHPNLKDEILKLV